jgi:hypothetical protein
MESSRALVKRVRVILSAPLAKARPKLALQVRQPADLPAMRQAGVLKASRLVEPRQVWENRLVQAKLESPYPVLAAWRSDPPRRAFFAPTRRLLPPWRD